MSRRGKDLFYLLEQRERGGRGQPEAAARRRAPSGTMTAKVRQWLGQPGGSRRAHESGAPVGFLVAAVGLAALGVGFALGRFLPRAEAPVDLTVRSETSGPRRPGPVEAKTSPGAGPAASPTASAADDLPEEKWEEVVSKRWFEVLRFPASQRMEAARAASFLRAHGVETTRIRKFVTEQTKQNVWSVVAYATPELRASDLLARLREVPATRTWPIADYVRHLTVDKLQGLTQDK